MIGNQRSTIFQIVLPNINWSSFRAVLRLRGGVVAEAASPVDALAARDYFQASQS
jgi:hypothetical protein